MNKLAPCKTPALKYRPHKCKKNDAACIREYKIKTKKILKKIYKILQECLAALEATPVDMKKIIKLRCSIPAYLQKEVIEAAASASDSSSDKLKQMIRKMYNELFNVRSLHDFTMANLSETESADTKASRDYYNIKECKVYKDEFNNSYKPTGFTMKEYEAVYKTPLAITLFKCIADSAQPEIASYVSYQSRLSKDQAIMFKDALSPGAAKTATMYKKTVSAFKKWGFPKPVGETYSEKDIAKLETHLGTRFFYSLDMKNWS